MRVAVRSMEPSMLLDGIPYYPWDISVSVFQDICRRRSFGKLTGPRLTAPPVLSYCIRVPTRKKEPYCFKTPFRLIPAIEPEDPKINRFVCRPRWGPASRNVPTDYSCWCSHLNAAKSMKDRVMASSLVPWRPGSWIASIGRHRCRFSILNHDVPLAYSSCPGASSFKPHVIVGQVQDRLAAR